MSDETIQIKVENSVLKDNWMVLTVRSFGANIKRKGDTERTVWATLDVPPDKVLNYARPLFPGAGPQPENTITHVELSDMVLEVIRSLEDALDTADKPKAEW